MKTHEYARMIEDGPRRNMSMFTVQGWLLILILVFLMTCLIVGSIQTMYSFKPSAEAIMSQQADMLARCDAMESQLIQVSEAVENWGGIKQEVRGGTDN